MFRKEAAKLRNNIIIKEKLSSFLSLPKEIALDLPLVTATGRREVEIENYKKLVEFTEEKVRIRTRDGTLTIEGAKLCLSQITTESVQVTGKIAKISYT